MIDVFNAIKRDLERPSLSKDKATQAELDRIREAILILSEKMTGIKN